MQHANRWMVAALIIVALQVSACTQTPPKASKVEPAKVERTEAAGISRVVLTEMAAQRLGIQTAPVRDIGAAHKQRFGGEVLAPPSGSGTSTVSISGSALPPGDARVLVRVHLDKNEMDRVDRTQPALIRPLSGDTGGVGFMARPAEAPATPVSKEATQSLYYEVEGAQSGLSPRQAVLAEVFVLGSQIQQKVIPYSAVIYDVHGDVWAYTNPQPLTFLRQRIVVDHVDGDQAILSEGPPLGTLVVTVGPAELLGAEAKLGGH